MEESLVNMTVRITAEQKAKLEEIGRAEYRNPSQLTRMAIDQLIAAFQSDPTAARPEQSEAA